MTLPRGFKAQAEREALRLRTEIGKRKIDPLLAAELARHLGIDVVSADDLVPLSRLEELDRLQAFAFSAATFDVRGRPVIVYNPLRTPGRVSSDLAHEIAHLLLEHDLGEIHEIGEVPFRTCNPDEEEQATAFGGTLLLPRPLLMDAALRGEGPERIADRCQVTLDMARFRYHTTGVAKQAASRRLG